MTLALEKTAIKELASKLRYPTQAFINGRFVDAASGKTFTTENPATGKVLAEIAACDQEDVDRAVQAARQSFESGVWSKLPPTGRKQVLLKLADLIAKHSDEIAVLEALDAGKPITDCMTIDMPETVKTFQWHAEAVDKLYDQIAPTGPEALGLIMREPIGVVGAIVPWNFPLLMAAWKLGPALATGNSVILKPAEQTTLSALRFAELAAEAGIPEGVLNVVPGLGHTAGQAIARHMDVDMVSFTGSTEIGRKLLGYSGETNLKRITLECGGKSPQVVMRDAGNLEAVAEQAANAVFWNMGENCSAGSRLIVHKSVKDELLNKIMEVSRQQWVVGDPLDPNTRVGSMIEKGHLEKVLSYIETGKSEGADLVLGGKRALTETGGYFIEPTIFDNVRNTMKIAREEIFGPVLSTIVFEDEEEAVQIANDTNYGLAASLYTDNLNVAHRVSRAIKAGNVSVNCYSEGDITTPFGGYKESGFGGRDNSLFAHDQYTQLKTIWIALK